MAKKKTTTAVIKAADAKSMALKNKLKKAIEKAQSSLGTNEGFRSVEEFRLKLAKQLHVDINDDGDGQVLVFSGRQIRDSVRNAIERYCSKKGRVISEIHWGGSFPEVNIIAEKK